MVYGSSHKSNLFISRPCKFPIMFNETQEAICLNTGMKFLQYETGCARGCSEVQKWTVSCLLKIVTTKAICTCTCIISFWGNLFYLNWFSNDCRWSIYCCMGQEVKLSTCHLIWLGHSHLSSLLGGVQRDWPEELMTGPRKSWNAQTPYWQLPDTSCWA